jgi:MoaA/NifB/PqqE/SkfB family radical SAM enzyme
MVREVRPRLLTKFVVDFGLRGYLSVERFKRRKQKGKQFPPFLFLSVTNQCNLRCQGCWVSTEAPRSQLDIDVLDRAVREGKAHGCHFYGILGGEPVLHPELLELFARHRNCYFQMFSNGTVITAGFARQLREIGNVTPVISVEGSQTVSDQRRGGDNVLNRTLDGIDHCCREGLITGVATSLCRSNLDDLLSDRFLDMLVRRGVMYAWYYVYRPAGQNPSPQLALDEDEIVRVREFLVEARCRHPIIIVDTYWDDAGNALCPAASGISYHLNPWGDIEPCPPLQFARENVHNANGDGLTGLIEGSTFLRDFRRFASQATRGCVILEQPDRLAEFLREQQATDTTGRNTGYDELAAMDCLPSQHLPGREIPEKHWAYRFAKKHWFFGFGAYG